jgi:hypothetical protein
MVEERGLRHGAAEEKPGGVALHDVKELGRG